MRPADGRWLVPRRVATMSAIGRARGVVAQRQGVAGPAMRKSGSQPGRACALVERCSKSGAAVESRRAARADGGGSIAGGRASHHDQAVFQRRKYKGGFGDRQGVPCLMDWPAPFLAGDTIALDERVFSNIVQGKIEHRLTCPLLCHLWGSALFWGALYRDGEGVAGPNPSCCILGRRGSARAEGRVAVMAQD